MVRKRYCSIQDIMSIDTSNLLDNYEDSQILEMIEISSSIVDNYCRQTFTEPFYLNIIHATAIITLDLVKKSIGDVLSTDTGSTSVKRESIGEYTVEYFEQSSNEIQTTSTIPNLAIQYLNPFIYKGTAKSIID